MGRKDKKYKKSLHQQAYDRLVGMQHFGESKKVAIEDGTEDGKIFSFNTYATYWKHVKYFTRWIEKNHPECTTLKSAKKYMNEWLQSRVYEGLSAWTVQTETAALCKLYQIKKDDPNRFEPPKRCRKDIKRSRLPAERDKHFSVTNNQELINFCRGTGLRRAGLLSIKGKDLITKDFIEQEISRLESIPYRLRSVEDNMLLNIYSDTRYFDKKEQKYYIRVKEKGGRVRLAPVVGENVEDIVNRFKNTAPDEKVWKYVNTNADIHSYRANYASFIYKSYARPIDQIPYDKINKGTGRSYQGDVYTCRSDEAGKKMDRHAMFVASKALGHNRIEVVANNYIRGL